MIYQKTHEGRAALRERNALNLRERQLMVLVNGSRTMDELADLFGVGVLADVDNLSRRGFVVLHGESNPSIPDILLSDLAAAPQDPPTRFLASELDSSLPPVPEIRAWDESRVTDSDEEVIVQHNWKEIRRFMKEGKTREEAEKEAFEEKFGK